MTRILTSQIENDFLQKKTNSFFGRRRGPRLRPKQDALLDEILPKLCLDPKQNKPLSLRELFPNIKEENAKKFVLEIGFGGGEHLIHNLAKDCDTAFIGVEPFVNSMAKLINAVAVQEKWQKRLRLFDDDAVLLFDWLPANSFDRIDMFYPDPWHKKKHWKRRFIQESNLNYFARLLKPNGIFRFASDSTDYINWTLFHTYRHPAFQWINYEPKAWQKPYKNWVTTRYETKALQAKRERSYLLFQCKKTSENS